MHWFPFALFLVAWVVAALSWLYGVAEFIGIWRFWPWAYRQGLCVVTSTLPESLARPANSSIELAEVKARADSAGDWVFRAPSPWLGLRLRTPFPIKGRLEWSGSTPRITGRLPVGTVGFFGAWMVGWAMGAWFAPHGRIQALWLALIGWGFAAALMALSLPLELRRFRKAQGALVEYLKGAVR